MIQGDALVSRIKYRRQIGNFVGGKRKEIAKYEIIRQEHYKAERLDIALRNKYFGFDCLHYSVSEASGSLKIKILNKTEQAGTVRALTIDAEAKAGEDFEKCDQILTFRQGEKFQYIEVKIIDDDNWEPDEDFFVHLLHPETGENYPEEDTKTRVTIIDDDKPGQICF